MARRKALEAELAALRARDAERNAELRSLAGREAEARRAAADATTRAADDRARLLCLQFDLRAAQAMSAATPDPEPELVKLHGLHSDTPAAPVHDHGFTDASPEPAALQYHTAAVPHSEHVERRSSSITPQQLDSQRVLERLAAAEGALARAAAEQQRCRQRLLSRSPTPRMGM
jgi:hypothetical protein